MANHPPDSLADSLEAPRELLPHMPFLLQDLWAMGCSVDEIVEAAGAIDWLPDQSTVLDLGCGKGAVSVSLAAAFGIRVVGIDAMSEFLDDARQKAAEYNVAHLCTFIHQDLFEFVAVDHDYDLVILASLGGILGSCKETVSILRTQVRSHGYLLIDDGYLRNRRSLERKGYRHSRDHQTTLKELTACGDLLVKEISTTSQNFEINEDYLVGIEKRGEELIGRYPEMKDLIRGYLAVQAEECKVLDSEFEGAVWLLQKAT